MAIALAASLVVMAGLLVLASVGERRRRRAEAQAKAESQRSAAVEAQAAQSAAAAERRATELEAARAAAVLALEQAQERVGVLEEGIAVTAGEAAAVSAQLVAAEQLLTLHRAEGTALRDELRAVQESARALSAASAAGRAEPGGAEAVWLLLLSRIERQWAAGVGARPDERGVRGTDRADQLTEAVGRELDRLREEAGVYAELQGSAAGAHRGPGLLLAVGEVLATVATRSDRVVVGLGEQVRVTAEGWEGDADELAELLAVLTGTGMEIVVQPTDGQLDVTLGVPAASPEATASPALGSSLPPR